MTRAMVQVGLRADGGLELALPGAEGALRAVPLRAGAEIETIIRVLQGLEQDQRGLGREGAPTIALARHWTNHAVFADDRCPWCRADARSAEAMGKIGRGGTGPRTSQLSCAEVRVRHVPTGKSGLPGVKAKPRVVATSKRTAAQLGL